VEVVSEQPWTLRILGRRDDLINVGGEKVDSQRVVYALQAIEGIVQASVYPVANSVTGQLVACEVVLCQGSLLTAEAIQAELREQLGRHEVPRIVRIVDALPLTASGKVRRRG
jgi:acyl-coenzyme A synthetase/AMP-(fatty) acid ligase